MKHGVERRINFVMFGQNVKLHNSSSVFSFHLRAEIIGGVIYFFVQNVNLFRPTVCEHTVCSSEIDTLRHGFPNQISNAFVPKHFHSLGVDTVMLFKKSLFQNRFVYLSF